MEYTVPFIHCIAYGLQALTPTKSHYSQTECQAFAVVWPCQHFHYYIYDYKTTITIDNKPLKKLLSSTSSHNLCIQRWILAYDTVIQYQPSSTNPADYLLWYPSMLPYQLNDLCAEHYLNMITNHAVPKSISIDKIENETSKDITLHQFMESIRYPTGLNIYNHSTQCNTNSVVIPKKLPYLILQTAHSKHQWIQKTKNILC